MKRLVGVASLIHRDSALTGTKPGRDAMTQAIFPIRGKSINAETKAVDVLLDNEEVKAIINILGCGILEDYDEKKLKFDKIILLSDADWSYSRP